MQEIHPWQVAHLLSGIATHISKRRPRQQETGPSALIRPYRVDLEARSEERGHRQESHHDLTRYVGH